ncbi:MAG: zinc ribbon domain-containing protein, partial [Clostridia bacterium]|nr:zinc ribbon domain-containing protein [Clostridia bacterium]
MIACKSCGASIAKSAKACPSCGAKNKKPIYKRAWFIILMAIVVIAIIASIAGGSDDTNPSDPAKA